MVLLTILAHHSEGADPDLLEWIKERIDAIVGLEPLPIVIILGLVTVSIPALILVGYLARRRRTGSRR